MSSHWSYVALAYGLVFSVFLGMSLHVRVRFQRTKHRLINDASPS